MIKSGISRLGWCQYFILLLAVGLLFFKLGKTTLVNWDEAWFAAVGQDISKSGEILKPRWNGEPWFYEPPLVTWVLAATIKFISTSPFALRFSGAAAGVVIIFLTYKLARLYLGNELTALLAALILLSNIEFLFRARQINVYIPLTLWLLVSLWSAINFARNPKRLRWPLLLGLALGLALLTARISALLAVPAVAWQLANKSLWKEGKRGIAAGILLMLGFVGTWYSFNYWLYGRLFLTKYFFGFTLTKAVTVNPATHASLAYYLISLRHAYKLWFPLVIAGLIWLAGKAVRNKQLQPLAVYMLSFTLVLTLAPNKASWFLIPAYPTLAISSGALLTAIAGKTARRKWLTAAAAVIFAVQVVWWHNSFIVPNTTGHQASIARKAGRLTEQNESIYLDDDWLPVAVFYSERKVVPLRFNRLPTTATTILPISKQSLILSNTQTYKELAGRVAGKLIQLDQTEDLLLLRLE